MIFPLDPIWADRFAEDWVAAWNAHDLDRILSHYAEDIHFSSPRIADVTGTDRLTLTGRGALKDYWSAALGLSPDLKFAREAIFVGSDSLTILYRNHRGQTAAETFSFRPDGLVSHSTATYRAIG